MSAETTLLIIEIGVVNSVLGIVAAMLKINESLRIRNSAKSVPPPAPLIVNVLIQDSPGAVVRINGPGNTQQ